MTDTSPEIEALYLERWKKVAPPERFRMGREMFTTAKTLALAGIRAEMGAEDPKETRRRLFKRFYSSDFSAEESERILAYMERMANPPE